MHTPFRRLWIALGAASVAFHVGLVLYGLAPALIARPIHFALLAPWVFVFMAKTRAARRTGLPLAALTVGACLWIALNERALVDQYGLILHWPEAVAGGLLLLMALEAARRAIGWPLPVIAALSLAYAFFGHHLPGEFGHPLIPWRSALGQLAIAEAGLWGKLTAISVGVVAIFVTLGAVLNAGEAGRGFMNIAIALAGGFRGGAGKVAVLASALFGSVSGSASANVASTGAVTLPAMKRLGYPGALAAAIEATASTGGQIMPPLMGAGAFVMVELTGTPYAEILLAATLPAILYFAAVWMGVDGFAIRNRLAPVAPDDRSSAPEAARSAGFFALPFAALLWMMFAEGRTPQFAGVVALGVAAALLIPDARLRPSWRVFLKRAGDALIAAGEQIALIGSVILCAAIVVGVLGMTGLGVKITSVILGAAGDSLWPVLLLTALACLVLGMEVPTTAAYVICVSVAGPALIEQGFAPLQAHLFVFWFALLSTITPPVCGAVFIAAGMAGENWLRVAGRAMILGAGLYLAPLGMAVHPALLSPLETPAAALLAFAQIGAGLALLSYALTLGRGAWRAAGAVAGVALALAVWG